MTIIYVFDWAGKQAKGTCGWQVSPDLRATRRASTALRVCPIMAFLSWASGTGPSPAGVLLKRAGPRLPCMGGNSGCLPPGGIMCEGSTCTHMASLASLCCAMAPELPLSYSDTLMHVPVSPHSLILKFRL